jgi:hypothetical protein
VARKKRVAMDADFLHVGSSRYVILRSCLFTLVGD